MSNKRILTLVLMVAVVVLLAVPLNRSAAQPTLSVGMYCISLGHQRLECHFDVSGGTAPYTYQFTPPASRVAEDVGIAIVPCAPVYTLETVTLVVTDSNGATGSASATAFCGDAQ
ncbi:MAG TPA: hypothetical protein VNZ44_12925 [Pyrinomonadaceae bacterium]|nr:hypothetical protein [Pyrinomonadaceae bacterium]